MEGRRSRKRRAEFCSTPAALKNIWQANDIISVNMNDRVISGKGRYSRAEHLKQQQQEGKAFSEWNKQNPSLWPQTSALVFMTPGIWKVALLAARLLLARTVTREADDNSSRFNSHTHACQQLCCLAGTWDCWQGLEHAVLIWNPVIRPF